MTNHPVGLDFLMPYPAATIPELIYRLAVAREFKRSGQDVDLYVNALIEQLSPPKEKRHGL